MCLLCIIKDNAACQIICPNHTPVLPIMPIVINSTTNNAHIRQQYD
uniref:Uncharacterized protein n=1 Tax=Arundo donax TaxID=35708 RepID=A0A0A9BHU3_ARUDO